MFCSAFVLYWILCAWLASFQIKKKNPPYMDWKLYLFISSLKRLSMKCADRAFTLLLSVLITFSTESLPSAISSSIVNGAFWWWRLWMLFLAPHSLCPLLCVGSLKPAVQAARRLVWCMGFIPWKALLEPGGVPASDMVGTHHSHLPAGYLSRRPHSEKCVWSELLKESLSGCWASQEMVSGLLEPLQEIAEQFAWGEKNRYSKHYTIWTT